MFNGQTTAQERVTEENASRVQVPVGSTGLIVTNLDGSQTLTHWPNDDAETARQAATVAQDAAADRIADAVIFVRTEPGWSDLLTVYAG